MSTPELHPFQPEHEVAVPHTKLGKFKASRMLVQESWAILQQDKEIMWFPVLSMLTTLVAAIGIGVLYFFTALHGDMSLVEKMPENTSNLQTFGFLLLLYTVMYFIVNFFESGMFVIAHGRMNGIDLSFKDGIAGAQEVSGKIFLWSLISATVGVVLHFIEERSKLAGKIIAGLLGTAWNILTYFSLLSLVIGKTTVKESFTKSAETIRKTWGETFIITIGTSLIFVLLFFAGFAITVATVLFVPVPALQLFVLIAFVLYALTLIIVSSSLNTIFKLALYEYATTGIVPKGYSPELMQGAVAQK